MAMRRLRLKAAVNLAPRRAAATKPIDPLPSPVQPTEEEPHVDPLHEPPTVTTSPPSEQPVPPEDNGRSDSKIEFKVAPKAPAVKPLVAPRRIIKPTVCLPLRKRKVVSNESEGKIIQTPLAPIPFPPLLEPQASDDDDDEIPTETPTPALPPPSPLPPAPHFKPPFLSPSMQNVQNQKRADRVVHNPFAINDENRPAEYVSDDAITPGTPNSSRQHPPQSPNKVRQRIRPTPCFGYHRRNSMSQGGNDSESDAEPAKRQRLISSSSTHSMHMGQQHPLHRTASALPSRLRTESVCSVMSDVTSMRDHPSSKSKKTARSEEFQRIVQAKREFSARFQGNKPDKARLTMFDMIFYNPSTNPMKNPAVKSRRPSTSSSAAGSVKGRRSSNASSDVSAVSKMSSAAVSSTKSIKIEKRETDAEVETKMPVPQLKLGPNGEIMLDEKSLVIETTGDREARETLANADIVYDDEFSGTSGFYKRSKRTRDWPPDETIRFYRCLHTIGTDFSLMLTLFPNRTRRDMKLKFKKEERNNPALINKALLHPKLFDIDELKRDFKEEEAELERQRVKMEEIKKQTAVLKKEFAKNKPKRSLSVRALRGGDEIHEMAAINTSKRYRKPIKADPEEVKVELSPLFNDIKASGHPSEALSEWFSNNEVLDDEVIDDIAIDDDVIEDDDIINENDEGSEKLIIDLSDIALSCKDDLFSDQYVENAEKALQSEDILNMEIIFEDGLGENATSVPHSDDIFDNLQIRSIAKIEKVASTSSKDGGPVAINDLIYFNTKDSRDPLDKSVMSVMDGDVVYYLKPSETTQSNATHTSRNSHQERNGVAIGYEAESIAMSPPEHVPDIEQQIADTSDDSQQSHSSAVSLQQYPQSDAVIQNPKLEKPDEQPKAACKIETKPSVASIEQPTLSNDQNKASEEADEELEDSDDDDEALASLANSLVVVARRDADGNIVHEVFLMSPTTGCLSDEPLDLPAEVIERIKSSLTVQNAQ